jgi:hypothetical protein
MRPTRQDRGGLLSLRLTSWIRRRLLLGASWLPNASVRPSSITCFQAILTMAPRRNYRRRDLHLVLMNGVFAKAVLQPNRAQAAAEFQFGIDKPWPMSGRSPSCPKSHRCNHLTCRACPAVVRFEARVDVALGASLMLLSEGSDRTKGRENSSYHRRKPPRGHDGCCQRPECPLVVRAS